MDLMKIRIHFYSDLKNHVYFFVDPEYDNELAEKFFKKLKLQNEEKATVLAELKKRLLKIDEEQFSVERVNKECSMYLYENQSKGYKNEDVFNLIRFAVSSNPVGAPVGDICNIIGKKAVIKRFDNTLKFIRDHIDTAKPE